MIYEKRKRENICLMGVWKIGVSMYHCRKLYMWNSITCHLIFFFKIKIDNVMSIKSILTDNVKIVTLDTFLRVQTLEFIVMWLDFSCAYHRPKNYNVILG